MPQYITGLVIRKNNSDHTGVSGAYKSGAVILPQGIGVTMGDIPVPGNDNGGASIDGDFWAVPVNDGPLSGFKFLPYNPSVGGVNNIQPDPQAFPVFKLSLNPEFGSDYWYIVGTVAQYLTAAGGGAALPASIQYNGTPILEAGCQTMCNQNPTSGLFFAAFEVPSIGGGVNVKFHPFGYFNGVKLPAAAAAGYTDVTALLAFLNTATTGWAAVGTWTATADGQTILVTQSAGPGTDKICAQIVAVNPSA